VHILGEFGQVETEVEIAREKSRGGQFPFCDKVLPKAERSAGCIENPRITSRGELSQVWECHSTIKYQFQEYIQNAQQHEDSEAEVVSPDPEEGSRDVHVEVVVRIRENQ